MFVANKRSPRGLQVPEIIINPFPSNAIFLNSFSTLATSFQSNFNLDKKSLLEKYLSYDFSYM